MQVSEVKKGNLFTEAGDYSNSIWEALEDGHLDPTRDNEYWTVLARNTSNDITIPFIVSKDYPGYLRLQPMFKFKPKMSLRWKDTNECHK